MQAQLQFVSTDNCFIYGDFDCVAKKTTIALLKRIEQYQ